MAKQNLSPAPTGRPAPQKVSIGVPPVPDALAGAVEGLTRATQALTAIAGQLAATLGDGAGAPEALGLAGSRIRIWEDDPFSEAEPTPNPANGVPTTVSVPTGSAPFLPVRILGPRPNPGEFEPGGADFRYWTAAESLARGVAYWAALLPIGTRWSTQQSTLQVALNAGQDLNAFYSRVAGLRFFERTVRNVPIFSGESPDVVLHELGHAVLDALRPQLFSAAFLEVAAFHEAFSDISSILCALQLPAVRARVLKETDGRLARNSRLSRVAEELGWGIRQLAPSAVDRDSLRNAANRFFYVRPETLPPRAPASQLSSESHSFSRVFTGAFLDALARMVQMSGPATDDSLRRVSRDMGRLLVDGVRTAPIRPTYYAQVAAAMIQADQVRNNGRYRAALGEAFIGRGILSPVSAAALRDAPLPVEAEAPEPTAPPASLERGIIAEDLVGAREVLSYGTEDDSHLRGYGELAELAPLRVDDLGLGVPVLARAVVEEASFRAAPARFDVGSATEADPEFAARAFVEDLVRLGRLDLGSEASAAPELSAPTEYKTHELEQTADGLVLTRLVFDCGLGGH